MRTMVLEDWYRPDLHSGKKGKLQWGKVAKILILERTTLEQWCRMQTTVKQGSKDRDTGKDNVRAVVQSANYSEAR